MHKSNVAAGERSKPFGGMKPEPEKSHDMPMQIRQKYAESSKSVDSIFLVSRVGSWDGLCSLVQVQIRK